jgi:hypothetical protein
LGDINTYGGETVELGEDIFAVRGLIFKRSYLQIMKHCLKKSSILILFLTLISFFALIPIPISFLDAKSYSKEIQKIVAPYLMPDNHPIKPMLDVFFGSSRVIFNLDTLADAGFTKTKPRKFTNLIVTKHSAFPGYVFKLYLDTQRYHKGLPEHEHWILRIRGAQKIRKEITSYSLEALFKVPQKWIYALPKHPTPPQGYLTKHYILIEEDMDILSDHDNKARWASDYVTTIHLYYLFHILKTVGLSDCVKPDNIPFSNDGRIAFIDTQAFNEKVDYKNLCDFLSASNQTYWKSLIKGN